MHYKAVFSILEPNIYIILDGLEGDTRIYCQRSPEKEPSNIIIIHIGLCVSSYYLTIAGDCWLPFCHRTKGKTCGT